MADEDYGRLHASFRLPHIGGAVCPHERPTLKNGRQRMACFGCRPKPTPSVRAEHRRLSVRLAVCSEPTCGKIYEQWLPHERYCSRDCYRSANVERMRNRQAAARDRSARKCKMCGESFAPAYADKRSVFCSRECKVRHGYQNSAGSTHRRRAKKFGVDYEPIKKWDVFARDDWTCQLCGVKTPRKFSGTQRDDAPELDHILPLAAGGAHIHSNVQCACRKCNLQKSDRPLGQMLLF